MRRNQLPSSNLVRQDNLLINHINQVLGTIFFTAYLQTDSCRRQTQKGREFHSQPFMMIEQPFSQCELPEPGAIITGLEYGGLLFSEEAVDIGESLDFERIAGRVQEEHGGLLADFAPEADIGLYHERHARRP